MNSFGTKFRVAIFGESHNDTIGVVIDGVKPGIALLESDFSVDLARRKGGKKGATPRVESDEPQVVSGVYNGFTTGAPLAILFKNENANSKEYENTKIPRPSHADLVALRKFESYNDPRGGGHFSGRMTVCLVAAGVVAKKMMKEVAFDSKIVEIGGCDDSAKFDEIIEKAEREGDSVGGIVECCVKGVRVGAGEPFFDSVESVLSHLLFSIPAIKGVEFGGGFGSARLMGSQNNDSIVSLDGRTATNNDGGINGGIANGNPIVVRVAIKPTPSISCKQKSINIENGLIEEFNISGRHDTCIALRAEVVVEAAIAIGLVNLL